MKIDQSVVDEYFRERAILETILLKECPHDCPGTWYARNVAERIIRALASKKIILQTVEE